MIPTIKEKEKFQWDPGWANPVAHTDINAVLAEFRIIEEVHGDVTAQLIVDSSKSSKSVIHNYFQWDDAKAANSWRLRQASRLISSIQIVTIKDGKPKAMTAYVSTSKSFSGKGDSPYIKRTEVTAVNISFIKKCSITDLVRVKNRLSNFAECAEAIKHIDLAIQAIQGENKVAKEFPVITTGKKTELAAV